MKRLLAVLLCLAVASSAYARHPRGGGGTTSGGSLEITTASLSGAVVGSAWVPGALTTSGAVGAVSCFQVSATPDDQQWMYLSPAGVPGGIPQNIETDAVTYECADAANGHTAQATFSFNTTASGALAVVSSTSLSGCASGGYCAYQTLFSGGTPPYTVSATSVQPWYQTIDQWIEGTPISTGPDTLATETISDSVGHTVSYTPTVTVGSSLTLAGIDPVANVIRLPQGSVGAYYAVQLNWYGGTGTSDACSTTSTLPSGITLSSGCLLSGTPAQVGAWALSVKITDSGSNTTDMAWLAIGPSGTVSRPAYNASTSNGFFTLNGRVYDPNGVPFNINGLDRNHYDSSPWDSNTNGALSGANTVRFFLSNYDSPSCTLAGCSEPVIVGSHIDNGELPILTVSSVFSFMGTGSISGSTLTVTGTSYGTLAIGDTVWPIWATGLPSGTQITGGSGTTWTLGAAATGGPYSGTFAASTTGTSGDTSLTDLALVGDYWAQMESLWVPYMNEIAINIANEWGGIPGSPVTEAQWASAYESIISQLRTAGYTCPIVIDFLNYGQDYLAVANGYAASVFNSDPLKNVIFSSHLYGTTNLLGQISAITKSTDGVITLNSSAATNPFVGFAGGQIYINGVSGMTQINGQTVSVTSVGGTSGAWTLTMNLNTSSYSTYISGGIVYDAHYYQVRMGALKSAIASDIPVVIGEFGPPGINDVTDGLSQFVSAAQAMGVPEIYWAWDDNNEGAGMTGWNDWFGSTLNGPGNYVLNAPSDLTAPGMDITLNPRTGLAMLAVPATVFH